jgi:hypothetical protein
MDIEKAKRVETILDEIKRCDNILDILNGELSSHYYGKGFALKYTSRTMPNYLTVNLPDALEDKIVNLIKDYKKELKNELEDM